MFFISPASLLVHLYHREPGQNLSHHQTIPWLLEISFLSSILGIFHFKLYLLDKVSPGNHTLLVCLNRMRMDSPEFDLRVIDFDLLRRSCCSLESDLGLVFVLESL